MSIVAKLKSELRWKWREFGWWIQRQGDTVALGVARRLPHWLLYWGTIVAIARATTGKYENQIVPELRAMDVLDRI